MTKYGFKHNFSIVTGKLKESSQCEFGTSDNSDFQDCCLIECYVLLIGRNVLPLHSDDGRSSNFLTGIMTSHTKRK
jgi:hypothetical protein